MRKDESFGVVPLRMKDGVWQVFLIQHKKARYWGLPKGHAEKGETPEIAAFRELKEETNLVCKRIIQKEPLKEEYQFSIEGKPVHKTVLYYIAEVTGDIILQKEEINDGKWIPFPVALETITHTEGKEILTAVLKKLENED